MSDVDQTETEHDPSWPPSGARARVGEMLIEQGLISEEHLEDALQLQRQTGIRLGETIVALGYVSSGDVARVLAHRLDVEFVELADVAIDPLIIQAVPEEVARRYCAIPLTRREGGVVVAMRDPRDVFAIDDLRLLLGAPVIAVMTDPEQIVPTIERVWSGSSLATTVHEATTDAPGAPSDLADLVAVSEDVPIVRLVNAILAQAVDDRASDVHLEPGSDRLRVRFRVDGVLHDASEAPLSVHRSAISRIKIMAGIDITQTRLPQDGRFSVMHNGRKIDVRMATLPTANGEAAVLRLLDQSTGVMKLEALGFEPRELERFQAAYRKPQGAILTSGPTGSGKTSTLYAVLLELNTPDRNIIAVEDPVEYKTEGIKQIQIDIRAGLTFPIALRSILRADPDVVLVGEIRDAETARIAAEASLTGHLVLSTIHTTRAAAVPLRLIDMGVAPFLVSSAVTCIVGQRLVRRLCVRCAEPYEPDASTRRSVGVPDELMDGGMIQRAVGCPSCSDTGYRGRVALYEIMPMTEDINRLVISRASSGEIERHAVAEGMDTLRMAALRRVGAGILSIDEMLRVIV